MSYPNGYTTFKDDDDEGEFHLQLFQWSPIEPKGLGHLALQIQRKGELKYTEDKNQIINNHGIYVSYWPETNPGCLGSVTATFHTLEDDNEYYLHACQQKITPKSIVINDLKLNANVMIEEFKKFYTGKNTKVWSLFHLRDNSSHCSDLVMSLLIKGGIQQHFPIYDRFGSFKHIILLSASRVFIITSILAHILYPILAEGRGKDPDGAQSIEYIFAALFISLLNGFIIFFFEKRSEPRQLIEMGYSDCAIGLSASFGIGFFLLSYRQWITPLLYEYNFQLYQKVLVDLSTLVLAPISAFLGGGLGSLLVYLFGGTGYVNHPSNVVRWVEYAQKMKFIDEVEKTSIFRKEFIFFFITYAIGIGIYVVRKFKFSRELSLYLGTILGVVIYFCLAFPYVYCLQKKLLQHEDIRFGRGLATGLDAIRAHDRSLVKYCLTCLSTTLGVAGMLSLGNRLNLGLVFEVFLTVPGSIVGFLIGVGFYQCCVCLEKKQSEKKSDHF